MKLARASLVAGAVVLIVVMGGGVRQASACSPTTAPAFATLFDEDAWPVVAVVEYEVVKVWPELEDVTRASGLIPVRLWGEFEGFPEVVFRGGQYKGVPPTTSSCGPAQPGPGLGVMTYRVHFEGGGAPNLDTAEIDFDRLEAVLGEPIVLEPVELPDDYPYSRRHETLVSETGGVEADDGPAVEAAPASETPAGRAWVILIVALAGGGIVLVWFGRRYRREQRSTRANRNGM